MDNVWFELTLVLLLTLLNAAFAGSEMALISLREGQLRRLERRDGAGRALARLARDPNRFLSTIQIGITLAGFLASATAAVSLAEPVRPALGFLGGAAGPVSIVLVTLVLTFVTLVIGELAPKRIAMQRAEGWAMAVARPLRALSALLRPANWVLTSASDLVVRAAGADPRRRQDEIGPEELRDLVASQPTFTRQQREIISGAVEIAARSLRAVLVPRPMVFALQAATPVAQAAAELAASGHARAPVIENGDLDSAAGIVHWADLVRAANSAAAGGTVRDVMRPALLLPESLPVADALQRFKAERQELALVVDERGAIDGIVTLTDAVAEVVGALPGPAAGSPVRENADGTVLLPGTFPIHDLEDVRISLEIGPDAPFTTVAGLVLARLGKLPTGPGETVTVQDWRFTVSQVRGRAITAVTAERIAQNQVG
ncbi:HlyC/CorC family transporter [Dactylosporangium vinaceum]|uniref:Hemolysin family protein n=1 Tax=Dactylosporangium vinaceum TaxID=53362 RepID=A0ABV5MQ24_9ACTN|nr:hemolysin family protein [Dactylosporangium vinaceum]UAB96596.1 HlyC/CorC family transporter [Dactylosporangium vinaceum]